MVLVVMKMMVIALSDDNGDVCVVSEGNRVGDTGGGGEMMVLVVLLIKLWYL